MHKTRGMVAAVATTTLMAIGIGPAAANDVSFGHHGSYVEYTDATDNLCVRATNDTGGSDSAYALIMNGNTTVRSSPMAVEGQGWQCTGNMSIPEDRWYTLVLFDCVDAGTGNGGCGGQSRGFYS